MIPASPIDVSKIVQGGSGTAVIAQLPVQRKRLFLHGSGTLVVSSSQRNYPQIRESSGDPRSVLKLSVEHKTLVEQWLSSIIIRLDSGEAACSVKDSGTKLRRKIGS